jgi:hypothetical protein
VLNTLPDQVDLESRIYSLHDFDARAAADRISITTPRFCGRVVIVLPQKRRNHAHCLCVESGSVHITLAWSYVVEMTA